MDKIITGAIVLVVCAIVVIAVFTALMEATNTNTWVACILHGGSVVVTAPGDRLRSWCDYGEEGYVVEYFEQEELLGFLDGVRIPKTTVFLDPIENPVWLNDPGPAYGHSGFDSAEQVHWWGS